MGWLKRNLVLVVGGVVALALLGAAGFFLWTKYQANASVAAQLTEAADTFTRLNQANPSITEENVQAAKDEQKRISQMLEENRKEFESFGSYTNMDSASFKALLETTIAELNSMATTYGVERPKNYSYTFEDQRITMQFEPSDLLPWTYQMMEIRELCEVLYRARVHSLVALRRARATGRDTDGKRYIIPKTRLATNTTVRMVISPYEMVFQGFTTELGQILSQLSASSNTFVVKNINIQPADQAPRGADVFTTAPMYTTQFPTGVETPVRQLSPEEQMRQRYGVTRPGAGTSPQDLMRQRYGIGRPTPTPMPVPQGTWTPATSTRRGPETVLDEKLLRFTMRVDAIRPLLAAK